MSGRAGLGLVLLISLHLLISGGDVKVFKSE
jgi:hypothetical protein